MGILAGMVVMSVSGCGSEKYDYTKESYVQNYKKINPNDEKQQYRYYIDIFELVSVSFEGGDGCGVYVIDTTGLENFILSHTNLAEGSPKCEKMRKKIQENFKVSGGSKGYLKNGDVITIQYSFFESVGVDGDRWLDHSRMQINDFAKKEFTVSGLKELPDDLIWEDVGYEFNDNGVIELVVDNDYHALEYKWDINSLNDRANIKNGDTFVVTAYLDDKEVGKKTFKVEGKPDDKEEQK